MNHPLNDLLDWYADDLNIIGGLPVEQLGWCIRDYVANRERYRS